MVALIIIIAFFAIVSLIVIYEARHAITVDPKLPFLHGDYDPQKDPTLK